MTKHTIQIQTEKQEAPRSETRSPVDQSTMRPNEQRQPSDSSVDNESPSSGRHVPSGRRGRFGNGSWRQQPIEGSNIAQVNSVGSRAGFGRQRNQRWDDRSPEQRGRSSHAWNQSSGGRHQQPSQTQVVKPSEQYMAVSQQASVLLEEPVEKKLLILDLNGTLVSRTKTRDSMYVRPYQDRFVEYIFGHFEVMVWSSAQPHSVAHMCRLFEDRVDELVLKWDRTTLGLTPAQYRSKSVTIKDLEKVWRALDSKYDATNTILLDDSPVKAQLQPYNSIHLREFSHTSASFLEHGESELLHVVRYLEKVRLQSNVCSFMKASPFVPPDPAQDEHNENVFETYHYVFKAEGRRLTDFGRKDEEDEVAEVERLLERTRI